MPQTDYAKLAAQHGGAPAPVDYATLAKQHGAIEAPAATEPEAVPESSLVRAVRAGGRAVGAGAKMLATVSGIPGFLREGPIGAIKDQLGVGKSLLQAQYEEYKKAKAAEAEGRTSEMVGRSVAAALPVLGPMAARMGEQIANDELPELIGETVAGVAMGGGPSAVAKGARAAKASRALKAGARVEGDILLSVPQSKAAPYTVEDFRAAKPYLNAQHGKAPIKTTVELRDSAHKAIGEIEDVTASILESFPDAQLNPGEEVARALGRVFKDHPRSTALERGLKEIEDYQLDRGFSLPQLDRIRRQLNAENKAVLKRDNSDVATARATDPGFAAREVTASVIRDLQYGYLENQGVKGVRQMRRDEGSLIKIRNAADRQVFNGQKATPGAEGGAVRRALGDLVDKLAPLPGVVSDPLVRAIKGTRPTRDSLVERAFSVADDRVPSYPTVPEGVKQAARESRAIDEALPTGPAVAPKAEQAFLLRWMADDLREMSFEPGSRMSRNQRMVEYEKATSNEAYREATYQGRTAGTPIQEMFHAAGIKGTRKEIAAKLDRYMQTGKGDQRIGGIVDAMREAWDGQRFDFGEVSDATLAKIGVRRRDLRSPVTTPYPDDMPEVYNQFFQRGGDDDFNFGDQ